MEHERRQAGSIALLLPAHADALAPPRRAASAQVVEHALAALQARWNTDPRDATVGIVRLSGLAHADERTAFSFIAKGLCK